MLDISKLYSFQGKEPQTLPHRIHLSGGRSRTDVTTFTEEEVLEAGFTGPYEKPEFDENTQFITWNEDLLEFQINEIPEYKEPPMESLEEFIFYVRNERNERLRDTDWTQLPDVTLTDTEKEYFLKYRQDLRDITLVLSAAEETYMNDISLIPWPAHPYTELKNGY